MHGYVSEGEKLVKISGLPQHEPQVFDAGTVAKHKECSFVPEQFCKVIGLAIFALMYIILLLFDYSRGRLFFPKKETEYSPKAKGMPLYEFN